MALKAKQVSLNLPFQLGGATFIVDESQQRAAWALYVELVTRVTVEELDDWDPNTFEDDDGILREALASLYNVFTITRQIIKDAGPEISDGPNSVGPIAINVLNKGLRPFLAKWHRLLSDWEHKRPDDVSVVEHEMKWDKYAEMRKELKNLQTELVVYADMLAIISGAKHIVGRENNADNQQP